MSMLKRLLYIEEGDFYKYGKKDDVQGIIASQLFKLYDDDYISYTEVLHKVELRGLFNLSYEEFEDVVRDIARDAIDRGADFKNRDTYSINPESEE